MLQYSQAVRIHLDQDAEPDENEEGSRVTAATWMFQTSRRLIGSTVVVVVRAAHRIGGWQSLAHDPGLSHDPRGHGQPTADYRAVFQKTYGHPRATAARPGNSSNPCLARIHLWPPLAVAKYVEGEHEVHPVELLMLPYSQAVRIHPHQDEEPDEDEEDHRAMCNPNAHHDWQSLAHWQRLAACLPSIGKSHSNAYSFVSDHRGHGVGTAAACHLWDHQNQHPVRRVEKQDIACSNDQDISFSKLVAAVLVHRVFLQQPCPASDATEAQMY